MAEAFRLKRACKALGPSTPFGTRSALRLRSLPQARGKQGKRGERPASPFGTHKPHPVKPSEMHSPRRAPRDPIRGAHSALHNSCYRKGARAIARSAHFFQLGKESIGKDWPRRECPRRRMLRTPCFWRKRIPPSSACWGHYLAILLTGVGGVHHRALPASQDMGSGNAVRVPRRRNFILCIYLKATILLFV